MSRLMTTGNIYVVEMTTRWSTPLLTRRIRPLRSERPAGRGRLSALFRSGDGYPADGGAPLILADDLDSPPISPIIDGRALCLDRARHAGTPDLGARQRDADRWGNLQNLACRAVG